MTGIEIESEEEGYKSHWIEASKLAGEEEGEETSGCHLTCGSMLLPHDSRDRDDARDREVGKKSDDRLELPISAGARRHVSLRYRLYQGLLNVNPFPLPHVRFTVFLLVRSQRLTRKGSASRGFELANHSVRSAFGPKFSPPTFVAVKPQLFPSTSRTSCSLSRCPKSSEHPNRRLAE
jgi:hypothetical protein